MRNRPTTGGRPALLLLLPLLARSSLVLVVLLQLSVLLPPHDAPLPPPLSVAMAVRDPIAAAAAAYASNPHQDQISKTVRFHRFRLFREHFKLKFEARHSSRKQCEIAAG
jgi:hypothetical protein